MPVGTVKWFNTRKGFGFIVPEDGTQDVFVHISDVTASGMRELRDGQKLSYELAEHNGRRKAVRLVNAA